MSTTNPPPTRATYFGGRLSFERSRGLEQHMETVISLVEKALASEGVTPEVVRAEMASILYRAARRRSPEELPELPPE